MLTPEEIALLARCHELTEQITAQVEPPQWQWWDWEIWRQQSAHGPRYAVGSWFAPSPVAEARRVRYRRALDRLAAKGLVVLHREFGTKLTNVALTKTGERLAVELAAQAATETAK